MSAPGVALGNDETEALHLDEVWRLRKFGRLWVIVGDGYWMLKDVSFILAITKVEWSGVLVVQLKETSVVGDDESSRVLQTIRTMSLR